MLWTWDNEVVSFYQRFRSEEQASLQIFNRGERPCRPDSYFSARGTIWKAEPLTDMKRSNHEDLNGDKLRKFGKLRERVSECRSARRL